MCLYKCLKRVNFPKRRQGDTIDMRQELERSKEANSTLLSRNLVEGRYGRILVVDDDRVTRQLISSMLSTVGFSVTIASDGNEGLNLFLNNSFDLVLTDLQMPEMDGWILALHIKRKSPRMPVVLMTGQYREVVTEKLKRGCIGTFLLKPFTFDELEQTIQTALDKDALQSGASGR